MRDPVLKLNTKPIQCRLSVPNWYVPFLAIISKCQVEQFAHRGKSSVSNEFMILNIHLCFSLIK
jgi:hypothetical protein